MRHLNAASFFTRIEGSRHSWQPTQILHLPDFYVATAEPDVMRSWGVADATSTGDYERLYPGGLVAPRFASETASRCELLYNGVESAAAFRAWDNARH